MKIAWFSPLAPDASDIANYTARLRPELLRNFSSVRFYAERPDGFLEHTGDGPGTLHPCHGLGDFPHTLIPELSLLDVPIYQIGNNADFHAKTWFLSQRAPGIVMLHDIKLHHFFEGIYRERLHDQAAYLEFMRRDYGSLGEEAGQAWWDQQIPINLLADCFPMTGWAMQNALAVVVHNPEAVAAVASQTDAPVWLLPLPYPSRVADAPSPAADDDAPFPADRRVRLVIFGFLHHNRRVVEFLAAWASMPERARFEVHFYGLIFHLAEVEATIERLGLGEQTFFHGYVTEDELDAGLAAGDLAINLRFPTMGEASGSQLRIWDHSLPSLVTCIDSYAALPPDTVNFVRPDFEREDIQRQLSSFLLRPGPFRERGRRGRACLLAEHSPKAYVERLRELLELSLGALRSRRTRLDLAGRVGRLIQPWTDGADRDEPRARALAEQIAELI